MEVRSSNAAADKPRRLRVLAAEGSGRAAPSVAMPRSNTELTDLLAGDRFVCVRRSSAVSSSRADSAPWSSEQRELAASNSAASATHDPEMAGLIAAWPSLPETIRAVILATVREATAGDAQ
jgi:hypothetical protein